MTSDLLKLYIYPFISYLVNTDIILVFLVVLNLISSLCFVLFAPSAEPSAAGLHHVGHKFHEVFQLKQGLYADLPATKISEMMKSNSLDVTF